MKSIPAPTKRELDVQVLGIDADAYGTFHVPFDSVRRRASFRHKIELEAMLPARRDQMLLACFVIARWEPSYFVRPKEGLTPENIRLYLTRPKWRG